MTMQAAHEQLNAGLGALAFFQPKRDGLGVPGPYGAVPSQVLTAGTYEISGTGVAFRENAGLSGKEILRFNPDTSRGDIVVGTPDQVVANGEMANADGLSWAKVTAQGKTGYVAVLYVAPVGWTAQQGKVAPSGGSGGSAENVKYVEETEGDGETNYTPWIIGGVAVVGIGIIGVLALSKKRKKARRAYA
jgi:hypothetical protein